MGSAARGEKVEQADRLPRAILQRRLERILAHIDATSSFSAEWTETLLGRTRKRSTFGVVAVYVVGSFARGAPLCGDLDLLVTIESTARMTPPSATVARLIARRAPRVQVHVGTPPDNSSLAKFDEAVLLWRSDSRDWKPRLDAIRVDPNAGRFARPTDSLPLNLRQMRMYDIEVAENSARLVEDGVLASQWTPLTDRAAIAPSSWDEEMSDAFERMKSTAGKATREVLPYAFQFLSQVGAVRTHSWPSDPTDFAFGPIRVRVGRPLLDVSPLDELGTNAIVMVPHRSRRGPNGVWVLTRGPKHSSRPLFAKLAFWVNVDDRGRLPLAHVYERSPVWGVPDHVDAELFTT
jgi:predicted nucleotidyltransferase